MQNDCCGVSTESGSDRVAILEISGDPVATALGTDTMLLLSYLLKIPFNLCTMDLSFDGFSSFLGSGFFTLFGVRTGDGETEASGLGAGVLATLALAA